MNKDFARWCSFLADMIIKYAPAKSVFTDIRKDYNI